MCHFQPLFSGAAKILFSLLRQLFRVLFLSVCPVGIVQIHRAIGIVGGRHGDAEFFVIALPVIGQDGLGIRFDIGEDILYRRGGRTDQRLSKFGNEASHWFRPSIIPPVHMRGGERIM